MLFFREKKVSPESQNETLGQNTTAPKSLQNSKIQPEQESTAGETEKVQPVHKPKSIWKRFIETIAKPGSEEFDKAAMARYRKQIKEIHHKQKEKRIIKKKKREKKKAREKMKMVEHKRSKGSSNVRVKGSDGVIRSIEQIQKSLSEYSGSAQGSRGSPHRLPSSSTSVFGASSVSTDDTRYRRHLSKVQSGTGPTHVTTMTTDPDKIKKLKDQRRRKISQLYSGIEVYHHSLSFWDHVNSKFYAKLDEEKRKKYPITSKIERKMKKIRAARIKDEEKRLKPNCLRDWLKKVFFQNSSLGMTFQETPRYYKMTPVVPEHCRRCRYLLQDTLEPRWTPIGITFAILFPIVGILCCLAYREFVCVVCEEIYVYGDYPSRCRPVNKEPNEEVEFQLRKSSFLRSYHSSRTGMDHSN